MASFSKMFDTLKLKIYDKYSENPGKLMVFAGTMGWALSCLAQLGAVVFNEKLTSKDKKGNRTAWKSGCSPGRCTMRTWSSTKV